MSTDWYSAHLMPGTRAWELIERDPGGLHRAECARYADAFDQANENNVLDMLAQLSEQLGPLGAARALFEEEQR